MNERNFTDKNVAMLGMWLVVSFDNCYIKLANISLAITFFSRDKINLISLYHEDTGRVTPIDLLYIKDNS